MSVWVLRVTSNGSPAKGWPASGVRVASDCPWASYPALARLGHGVALAWIEARDQIARVQLAAFDSEGRPVKRWPANGITLSSSGQYGDAVELAGDGRGGAFAAWTEMQGRLSDLHVAHAPEDGSKWRARTVVTQAVPVDANILDRHPEIVADGRGGAITVWTDERNQERKTAKDLQDVFAQRITSSGRDAPT